MSKILFRSAILWMLQCVLHVHVNYALLTPMSKHLMATVEEQMLHMFKRQGKCLDVSSPRT